MELEKKYKIDDNFIGIFDNFFSEDLIKNYLSYYEYCEKNNLIDLRQNPTIIKDSAVATMSLERSVKYNNEELINIIYRDIYPLYVAKFASFNNTAQHSIFEIKVQKTKPSEGFHVWHSELLCRSDNSRLFTFILYLNDVLEGGETEFLYQRCRVNALKNRFVLWPAGITHQHRGNPPLKNEKYILTGWMEFK